MHVAEAAHGAIDQVLAFTRAVQPPRDFDVTRERVGQLTDRGVAVSIPIGAIVSVTVLMRGMKLFELWHLGHGRDRTGGRWKAGQTQADLSGRARLAGVAPVENHVFHLVAAQALGALFTEDPGNGVGDVALAASIGTDDGGDTLIEGELRAIGEGLETRDFETLETHYCPLIP